LSELETTVENYLDSIGNNDGPAFELLSRRLGRMLISPLMPKLETMAVDTLVILPDGPLHRVPFGSLMDSQGVYLLERFTLSYAPSRSILNYCLAMNKAKGFSPASSMLLMEGTSHLMGTKQEVACISRLYNRSNRVDSLADIESVEASVGGYEIIHFSGHAKLYRGKPRLVFHAPKGDNYLDSSVIEGWSLTNDRLVSLAGCSTGVGPIFDGESPWGLVPAFLNAGAPAILVTLLPVEDFDTGRMTERFYELLSRGNISKAGALRQAQLALLENHRTAEQKNPNSWVPFVLVGDPR